MSYLTIMKSDLIDVTKIGKVAVFETQLEADDHVTQHIGQYPDAFVVEEPTLPYAEQECVIDVANKTLLYDRDKYNTQLKSTEYIHKRQAEYPSIGEQLDKIYHEGIDAWKADMIKPVKDKYAK